MNKLDQNRQNPAKAFILALAMLALAALGLFLKGQKAGDKGSEVPISLLGTSSLEPLENDSTEQQPADELQEPVRIEVLSPKPSPPEAGTPGAITGIVLTPLGQPLQGATCSLHAGDPPQGLLFVRFAHGGRGEPIEEVLSNAEGAFALNAPTGYWTLQIEYDGLQTYIEEFAAAGSFRRVVMQQEHQLLLHVVDSESRPIEGAQALLIEDPYSSHAGARDTTVTDSSGNARLALQPGTLWFVVVMAPDHISTYFKAPPFGQALLIEQTVTLPGGVRITGHVVDPRTGYPPPGAKVLIDGLTPDPTRTVEVDATGHFDSGAVFRSNCQLELTARAPGYAENRVVLDFMNSPLEEDFYTVELPLESSDARVEGRVLNTALKPVGPVDILLKPLGPGRYLDARDRQPYAIKWRRTTTTDAEGHFKIEGLKANYPYELLAVPRSAHMSKLARIPSVEAGKMHDLGVIEVPIGASLTGRVLNADGTPAVHLPVTGIPTTRVNGTDPDFFPSTFGWTRDGFTKPDGRFEITMLNDQVKYEFYWGEKLDLAHRFAVFTPEPGEHVGPIEVVLPPAGTPDAVHLRGLVRDLQGEPLGSVIVEVWNEPQTKVIGEGLVRGLLTHDDGVFDLEVPQNTEYRLTATDIRGRFLDTTQPVVATDTDTTLWIEMTPSNSTPKLLDGVVTDASGAPLAGIAVTLHLSPLLVQCSCLSWSATSDAQGHFSFGRVTEGRHRIALVDPTGAREAQTVPVEPGEPIAVTMSTCAAGSL